MIEYNFIKKFDLPKLEGTSDWIEFTLAEEDRELGEINFIFCDDDYLLDINRKQLKHNTLTDIISLDYSLGHVVSGDIYISVDRVRENASERDIGFLDEMHRVMIHGILHYVGYKDKSEEDRAEMRSKEDYYLSLRAFLD